jgi:S1-C subfamily serine protease
LQARSLWYSPQQDIAFLRVDPAAIPFPDAAVTLASWTSFPADDVDAPSQFSPVMAVGNPARFPFTAMQGVYVGVSYRTNEAIGGTRERNVLNWKALMQSAGGASGSPVFNAAGAVVGALFAGGATSDPRFAGGTWRTEAMMVAADYVSDALGDGLADGRWPVRGGCGLELDLVPLPTARAFYGLKKEEAAALAAAGAAAGGPASPTGGPPAPLRPRDRVIVVAGVEPGAPTKAAVSAVVRPGDILWAVDGALLGGDLRAFERALHARVNGSVGVMLVRGGAVVNATLPVYDLTVDRVTRYATWAGGIFHDVSDRTRYVYRVSGEGGGGREWGGGVV